MTCSAAGYIAHMHVCVLITYGDLVNHRQLALVPFLVLIADHISSKIRWTLIPFNAGSILLAGGGVRVAWVPSIPIYFDKTEPARFSSPRGISM